MASKRVERCSAVLVIRETQIKTTRDATSYPSEWLLKKPRQSQVLARMWKEQRLCTADESRKRAALAENGLVIPQKTNQSYCLTQRFHSRLWTQRN